MPSRRLPQLALAAATVAAGFAIGTPARAAVAYDPETKTGLVDKSDVQTAFAWSDAMLASRAPEITFDQNFWTHDTYTVSCGATSFPVVHPREYGKFVLAHALAHRRERGGDGYAGKLTGFRITGATAGISGTAMPPEIGQPCPRAQAASATIEQVSLVSTTTGWALVANFADVSRDLLVRESPAG